MNDFSSIKAKYIGTLLGLAIGDYLGMPVEFTPTSEKVINFFGTEGVRPVESSRNGGKPAGYYTDDTSQALCLASSLLEKGFNVADQLDRYKKWAFEGYMTPDNKASFGIGQNTFRKLNQKPEDIPDTIENKEREGGNGALMRTAPIGLMYWNNKNELKEYSIKSALVTHNNEVACWSCVALNHFLSQILKGNKDKASFPKSFLTTYGDEIPEEIKKILTLNYKTIKKYSLPNTGYALHTLSIAIWSFLTTDSFQEAVSESILSAGDTDTQGAVTGALAGCYYGVEGIPKEWLDTLMNKAMIENLAEDLHDTIDKTSEGS